MNTIETTRHSTGFNADQAPKAWKPPTGNGFKETGQMSVLGLLVSLVFLAPGGWMMYQRQAAEEAARLAHQERLIAHHRLVASPPLAALPVGAFMHGKTLFEATCAACHKADGTGMPGLGKDLTASWFVASLDDEALRRFVTVGRPVTDPLNTTRMPMLPKGGHDYLTDADLADIVTHVRALQDPRRIPEIPAEVLAEAAAAAEAHAQEVQAQALAAAGGDKELAEYIAYGTKLFAATCVACHGKDAKGLPSLGKSLLGSEFVRKLDDDGLLEFIKKGRDSGDPANTTGIAMLPKGGNPALSDDDILDIIAYIRSLDQQAQPTP